MVKTIFEQMGGTYEQAEDMFSRLVKHVAEREGVTEKLKAENQMEWVRPVSYTHLRAHET